MFWKLIFHRFMISYLFLILDCNLCVLACMCMLRSHPPLLFTLTLLCFLFVGEWSAHPKVNSPVYSAATCVCNGYVYVLKHTIERCFIDGPQPETWQCLTTALPFEIGLFSAVSVDEKIYILGNNICSLVCFNTQSLTFDTLATFQPYVQRHTPVLCLKDPGTLIVVSEQQREGSESESLRTIVEEFDIKEKKVSKDRDLGFVIKTPQVLTVPYYPKFRL